MSGIPAGSGKNVRSVLLKRLTAIRQQCAVMVSTSI